MAKRLLYKDEVKTAKKAELNKVKDKRVCKGIPGSFLKRKG